MGNQCISEDVLSVVVSFTEKTLNQRPLTSVSDNIGDLEVITPNNFSIEQLEGDVFPPLTPWSVLTFGSALKSMLISYGNVY